MHSLEKPLDRVQKAGMVIEVYSTSKNNSTITQPTRRENMPELGGKEVGPIGFGLLGLTWRPTPPSQEQAFEAMHAAIKNGCM
jgi:hypothetical protein